MSHDRSAVACMMRVRNEARWIRASLERTFQVAQRIVVLDDGSDDSTVLECLKAAGVSGVWHLGDKGSPGLVRVHQGTTPSQANPAAQLPVEIHLIHSPFRPATVRPQQGVSEIRDKNHLWEYCKANVPFRHMLCLDGDELLSKRFVSYFHTAIAEMEAFTDVLTLPFLYLWDSDEQIRVDGIYGNAADGLPILRFPRLFTIDRLGGAPNPGQPAISPGDMLHVMRFSWQGTKGGFHCGSIPREMFRPKGSDPTGGTYGPAIIHYGYRDEADRQRKFVFYNEIDPNNEFEGCYRHIIGEPDRHAPGPVQLRPYHDLP